MVGLTRASIDEYVENTPPIKLIKIHINKTTNSNLLIILEKKQTSYLIDLLNNSLSLKITFHILHSCIIKNRIHTAI